jgi:alpha-tubulin suppressor-like RCC1 family protein
MASNELWAWGNNDTGVLGDGTVINRSSPVQNILSGGVWAKVSTSGTHTLGIKTNGTLWSWGEGSGGAIGNNDNISYSSPVQIGSLSWKEISAGFFNNSAIRSDGTLWTWGVNYSGVLGLNDTDARSSPVQIGRAHV